MKTIVTKFNIVLSALIVLGVFSLQAQDKKDRPSPPAEASGKIGSANITIKYSSPAVKGRTVWGDLVPYGEVWRAGANEATIFETDKDITVEGMALPKGKYSFFTIPGESEWVIIFNKNPEQWGAYSYDESMDALRVTVKPAKSSAMNERLTYAVNKKGIVLSWENLDVPVSVK